MLHVLSEIRSRLCHTMSASTTPANIIQQDEKNPRGIPKALFIVRSSVHPAPAHCRSFVSPFCRTTWRSMLAAPTRPSNGFWPHSKMSWRAYPPFPPFISHFCTHSVWRRKYRYMDSNLTQRRRGLEEKIPEIKKTLSMVEFLRERRVRSFICPFFLVGDWLSVFPGG